MIERKFVLENLKEFAIKEYVASQLNRVGLSDVKLQRTPLGEKIIVSAARPGLVVGRGGSNIQKMTRILKEKFNLENPQIEIEEIKNQSLDPAIIAEEIAITLERFGTKRFKSAGHKAMEQVMNSGALGVEILISGKIPSQRAKTWRFYEGYLKKCGDISISGVNVAYRTAHLKPGSVGIKVSIMPSTTILPDNIEILEEPQTIVEEITNEEAKEEKTEEKEEKEKEATKEKKKSKKKTTKKKDDKKTKTTKEKTSKKKTTRKTTTKKKETNNDNNEKNDDKENNDTNNKKQEEKTGDEE